MALASCSFGGKMVSPMELLLARKPKPPNSSTTERIPQMAANRSHDRVDIVASFWVVPRASAPTLRGLSLTVLRIMVAQVAFPAHRPPSRRGRELVPSAAGNPGRTRPLDGL